ncbi:MAG: glycosyltransferase, partial [Leptolyngbya sp. SIO3F4]|nr:glycosyltransferase [Leptolyngbya sp. SIO3F4]
MDDISQPLVSVVLPTYNGEEYVAQSIKSVLSQTYQYWEFLISDDASKDDTQAILKSYSYDPRLKLFFNQINSGGIFSNLNSLLEKAQGHYIMVLCQDDYLDKKALSICVSLLEKYHDSKLLFTLNRTVDSEGNSFNFPASNIRFFSEINKDLAELTPTESLLSFLKYGSIGGSLTGYFFDRDILLKVGYFKDDWKYAADWEWSYRVTTTGKILVSKTKLVNIRIHRNQVSNDLKVTKN